jgi:hypothetical protein
MTRGVTTVQSEIDSESFVSANGSMLVQFHRTLGQMNYPQIEDMKQLTSDQFHR